MFFLVTVPVTFRGMLRRTVALAVLLVTVLPLGTVLVAASFGAECQMKCARSKKTCCCRKTAAGHHFSGALMLQESLCDRSCKLGLGRTQQHSFYTPNAGNSDPSLPIVQDIVAHCGIFERAALRGLEHLERPPPQQA